MSSLLVGTVAADAAPATHPQVRDLGDDMISVPGVDVAADVAADAARRSATRRALPATNHLVYVSVVDVTATSRDNTFSMNSLSRDNVTNAIQKLNAFWNEETNGAVTFSLGGYEVHDYDSASCSPDEVSLAQSRRAFGGAFENYSWVGSQRHLVTLTREGLSCYQQAFGTVGGKGGEIFDANGLGDEFGIPILLHEMGHNLGFGHADVTRCLGASVDAAISHFTYSSTVCPTQAYGDTLDIMGFTVSNSTPHLSALEKIQFGYFDGSYVNMTGPGTLTLNSASSGAGLKALRVTDPLSGAVYVIEYRTKDGRDANSPAFGNPEVGSVRVMREIPFSGPGDDGLDGERNYTETTVLATGAAGGNPKDRTPRLEPGETFTSINRGFTLTVDAASPAAGATVTFAYPVHTATTVTLSASRATQTFGAKTGAVLTATVTAADGSPVAGGTVTIVEKGVAAVSAPVRNGAAVFALSPATRGGKHAFTARYATNDVFTASASNAVRVTVKKAHARAGIRLPDAHVSRDSTATAKITVKVAGVKNPTGKVAVYANGKKLKTYTLKAKGKGKLTVELPKFSKTGLEKVYVKYLGTRDVAADNSNKQRLRITR